MGDDELNEAKRAAERAAFQQFLEMLGSDPEEAGRVFTSLHTSLVIFAERHKHADPEGFADRVLTTLQEKARTERIINPRALAYAVARNIELAEWRSLSSAPISISDMPDGQELAAPPTTSDSDRIREELTDECLEHCLKTLSSDDLAAIVHYYNLGSDAVKDYVVRKGFASKLGIRTETLAVRVHRIRKRQLGPCIDKCVKAGRQE
jgi:DNA-directed RNA polymerase specialized sigma24 family protein